MFTVVKQAASAPELQTAAFSQPGLSPSLTGPVLNKRPIEGLDLNAAFQMLNTDNGTHLKVFPESCLFK